MSRCPEWPAARLQVSTSALHGALGGVAGICYLAQLLYALRFHLRMRALVDTITDTVPRPTPTLARSTSSHSPPTRPTRPTRPTPRSPSLYSSSHLVPAPAGQVHASQHFFVVYACCLLSFAICGHGLFGEV